MLHLRNFPVFFLLSMFLVAASPCVADGGSPAFQVVDLDDVALDEDSNPKRFLHDPATGTTYFAASDPRYGEELWATDGSDEGAQRITDLCPGVCSSWPRPLAIYDGRIYFVADDGYFGAELWATDGTPEGTSLVADVCVGTCSGLTRSRFAEAVVFQDQLIFRAVDSVQEGPAEFRLWATDGTRKKTRPLPISTEVCPGDVAHLHATENRLYFACDETIIAFGAQTGAVALFEVGDVSMTTSGDELFVKRPTAEFGEELWKTDGTPEGTNLVVDLCPGPCSGVADVEGEHQGRVYATGEDDRLYRTDAAASGMEEVFDRAPTNIYFADEQLYLHLLENPSPGVWTTEIWRTDDANGLLRLFRTEYIGTYFAAASGDRLYFYAEDEVWTSDGTLAGTQTLSGWPDGARIYSDLSSLHSVFADAGGGDVFFGAEHLNGIELWRGDAVSARQIDNLSTDPGSGRPNQLAAAGDRMIFTASDRLVRSTDGTQQGALTFQSGPTAPAGLFPHQDRVFFSTESVVDDGVVSGLWATDGGEPELVADDLRGVASMTPFGDDRLLLEAATQDSFLQVGSEVWMVDPTTGLTEFTADVSPGFNHMLAPPLPHSAWVTDAVAFRDRVVFAGGHPFEPTAAKLWISDGTGDGTVELLSCPSGAVHCPVPREMTVVRERFVVFSAWDESAGRELWRTNGTPQGTRLLKDLRPGVADSAPHDFHSLSGQVLFFARDEYGGESLWRTDGSIVRTRKIASLHYAGAPSHVVESARVGDRVFMAVANPETGVELWSTDGTAAGTGLVREIVAGARGAAIQEMTAIDGRLFFSARSEDSGLELWTSDGTAEGTVCLTDVAPGAESSAPAEIRAAGDLVYFSADDGETGRELWAIPRD